MITSFVGCIILALVLIRVDRVVTAQAVVVSKSPTLVVQPLDTAIVRSINVHEGQLVRSGEVLARLDPTFASADQGALAAQVSGLQAQVSRLQAEADARPFAYTGLDPDLLLQAAIFGQRKSEYDYKIENYAQKINSLGAAISKAKADVDGYRDRVALAVNVETMRKDLERLQVGSKLNTLAAMDNRAEMVRNMNDSQNAVNGSERDLAAEIAERDGFIQSWRADISQQLSDTGSKLSDARAVAEQGAACTVNLSNCAPTATPSCCRSRRCPLGPCCSRAKSSSGWSPPTRRWRSRAISLVTTTVS